MDLNAVMTDRASASCEYMGMTLNFKYRPAMVTMKTLGTLQSTTNEGELAEFFSKCVSWWDLTKKTEREGEEPTHEMVPITVDIFTTLPAGLVRAMARSIIHDNPERDEGN